jgi:DNA-binding beta-propeller fold protein YncE
MSRSVLLVVLVASSCVPMGGFDAGTPRVSADGGATTDAGFDAGQTGGWSLLPWAGTGAPGLVDGPGETAQFNQPSGLAIDALGNLFVADTGNRVIRKIDPNGFVTTVSPQTFVDPEGVAVDSRGIVYVADTREQCVKTLDPMGRVRDFSGTCAMGVMGFRRCYDSTLGTLGPGDIAGPMGMVADSDAGTVYIADAEHQLIRFASMTSRELGTLAGRADTFSFLDGPCGRSFCCGTEANFPGCRVRQGALFRGPSAVALSSSGALLVADRNNCAIRKISTPSAAECRVSTVFGAGCEAGAPLSASLNSPLGVAGGPGELVYVSDSANQRVVLLDPSQPMIARLTELPGKGTFLTPWGIAVDGTGRVFVVDSGNNRVRMLVPP